MLMKKIFTLIVLAAALSMPAQAQVKMELKNNKICHAFHFFLICQEVMGPDAMVFVF